MSNSNRMRISSRLARTVLLSVVLATSPGCLVLSLHPAYDDESIEWDPNLLGTWRNAEDGTTVDIARGEWRSYRLSYTHTIESGELTGYLTSVGGRRYLDVMPVRGEDHGSFLVPVHGIVLVRLDGDTLEVTGLSYDWFSDRISKGQPIPRLQVIKDPKENALIVSETTQLRAWLGSLADGAPEFGAPASFVRTRK